VKIFFCRISLRYDLFRVIRAGSVGSDHPIFWRTVRSLWYSLRVKIYVDADGAPGRDTIVECAQYHGISVVLVADVSHPMVPRRGEELLLVDKEMDSSDFAITNLVKAGDLVITQDMGLAALVLGKGATVITPRGTVITDDMIDQRLAARWVSRKMRAARERVKGPKPLSKRDRERFLSVLNQRISQSTELPNEIE
jgi:uncharacterized protein YaiI (UPF0178 family)